MATADWPQEVAVALIKGAHVLFEDWLGEPLAKSEALWRSVLPSAAVDGVDHFLATTHQSVHAQGLPLMNPYHVATIIVIYLLIVLGGLALPLPAFDLKLVRIIHNATLVALSGYMMFEVLRQAYLNGYSVWGNPQDESPKGLPVRCRARISIRRRAAGLTCGAMGWGHAGRSRWPGLSGSSTSPRSSSSTTRCV